MNSFNRFEKQTLSKNHLSILRGGTAPIDAKEDKSGKEVEEPPTAWEEFIDSLRKAFSPR